MTEQTETEQARLDRLNARQPAYDAVFAYIRQQPRDFLPATVVDRNAMIWRAVNAALDAQAAVSAVVPPADQADVYTEVADRLAADAEQGEKEGFTRIYRRSAAKQVRDWAAELRRVAGETQQPEPVVTVHAAPNLSPAAQEALGALVEVAKQQIVCDFDHPHPEHPCGTRVPEEEQPELATTWTPGPVAVAHAAEWAQQPETQAVRPWACAASYSGRCLAEAQSETACNTDSGECVHGGRPAVVVQPAAPADTQTDRVVAWRSLSAQMLRCLEHVPPPAARAVDCTPVTSDDLPDGGICTFPDCGVDVLIPQERP